ncbi:hypothetical protein dsx2_2620 [Desulfovibrio sp. X2]|uniref:hypothetical protein n=1 Tax=Desulfovibrio sp. X2 TaxID=941449 RepID=UPI000358D9BE|nr:hypothetical protein [Desulfovibrio sp. X2]EPR42703.1 hypothetical protein dsx2_2620 [Desulfovibrio sp. X2]
MIQGGYILKARKTLESELMDKPPLYSKLWDWMLLRAEWRDGMKLKRGQFHTTIEEMRDAMSWHVGYRLIRPTIKEIRSAYEWFARKSDEGQAKGTMIGITKGTRGMLITVYNYELYQDPKNYEGHNEGHNEKSTKGELRAQDRLRREEEKKEEEDQMHCASGDAQHAQTAAQVEFFLTAKKRKLTGKRLAWFERFWSAFNYKRDKRRAADAWIDIPELTDSICQQIVTAAEREAAERPALIAAGRTPKMAQGWITGRRWEDEESEPVPGAIPMGSGSTTPPMTPYQREREEQRQMAARLLEYDAAQKNGNQPPAEGEIAC